MRFRWVLPLPRFVLHPVTAVVIAVLHVYPLAFGHLRDLLNGDVQWTHIWKGFGALGGAYVFAALASRSLTRPPVGAVGTRTEADPQQAVGQARREVAVEATLQCVPGREA